MIVSENKIGREHIIFQNDDEKLEKLKELDLISPKAKVIKQFMYKGFYVDMPVECDIVGYVDDNEIILDINGESHCIHPDYLKQMQDKSFRLGFKGESEE